MSEIVLGVTGSIAAYKAAELCRAMVRRGWGVRVVMTDAATKFVGPLTFQTLSKRPVALDTFTTVGTWEPNHIMLGQGADLYVIAPCTANVLAKLAGGIADDEVTATALASKAPLLVAPAMNDVMFENMATQENIATLRRRGVQIIEPGCGELACGCVGRGRMADVRDIIKEIESHLQLKSEAK